jgi:transposase-like protein
MQRRRNKAVAKSFFERVMHLKPVFLKIVTDQLRSFPAAKAEIPELANMKHLFVKATARVNNRAENSDQPTRERERRMRGFRDPKRTQKFLSCFGPIVIISCTSGICCALHVIANNLRCLLCRLAQIYRAYSKSVVRFLISRHTCRLAFRIS